MSGLQGCLGLGAVPNTSPRFDYEGRMVLRATLPEHSSINFYFTYMGGYKSYIEKNWKPLLLVLCVGLIFGFSAKKTETVEKIVSVPVAQECEPEVVTKEVEKVVYKDTVETTEYVEDLEWGMTALSESYILVFDVAKAAMDYAEMPIHSDHYEMYEFAKEWKGIADTK